MFLWCSLDCHFSPLVSLMDTNLAGKSLILGLEIENNAIKMWYFITFCSNYYVLRFFFRNFGALLLIDEPIAINMDKDINRIKVVLADKKRTNKWLAEQLGKDPATVSKWCTNNCQPTLETMIKIAQLLDVELNDLVRFSNKWKNQVLRKHYV